MSNFRLKFSLVLWKNFIIRKRHYILSAFEILISVLIFGLLGYSRTLMPSFNKIFINETQYHEDVQLSESSHTILYAPNHKLVNEFMNSSIDMLPNSKLHDFATENDMVEYMQVYADNHTDTYYTKQIGIIFENFPENKLPKNLKYHIRTETYMQVDSLFDYAEPFQSTSKRDYFSGFLQVQRALDVTFIKQQNKVMPNFEFEIIFQEMPYPPRMVTDQLMNLFLTILPFCTILAFVLVFPSVLKRVIEEKSTGIKELMKMMGLEAWMLWLGWYIHSMVSNIIAISFIVIMLKVGFDSSTPIIEYGDASIIWIFLFLYCSAGICFCFLLSTPFKKPTMGMCVGMLIWMVSFFAVNPLVSNDDPTVNMFLRYFVMILPNSCLMYGYKAIMAFEKTEIGLTWSNFVDKPNAYTPNPSMGFTCLMLIVDCLIFIILTWYIENVFPGEYGIARRWYFPFTKSYWCTNKVDAIDGNLSQIEQRDEIESVPLDAPAGVQIRNLSKSFNKKAAVDNLSFDVYDNQITVLLGHNGAGKTTTMNIITGMISPNSGTVVVNGFNIQRNINKVRESLGLCPQHNLQFSDLTVLEHLMFFAMLKGLSKKAAKLESEQFLSRLNISSKANKMARELSGGMRRKLSLGMALVGHTRVLMLDEPTSGMDPEARREIWDFLLSMRGERTILITTHYMEEADILGDRIAIMHHGQLMCYGTSLFLKKHYGTGYTLSLLVTQEWNINKLTEAIQQVISSASVKSISAGCVTFVLPTNDTTALSALFLNLEMNKNELCISNFGVSLTTMEEVFLRVGEIADEADKSMGKHSETDSTQYLLSDATTSIPEKDMIQNPMGLLWHQFYGLFIKRFQYTLHRWILFIIQVLIPLALVIFIMITMKMSANSTEPDVRRDLVLDAYAKSQTFYSFNNTKLDKLAQMYERTVKEQKGKVSEVDSVSDAIVKIGIDDLDQYHRTLIASAEFNQTQSTWTFGALYGDWALHGPPISLNLITNAVLKTVSNDPSASIAVVNNPWPSFRTKSNLEVNLPAILMWMFQFPVAFTIMVGFFLIFPQEERLTGVKHLQLMAGVPRVLYWAAIYIFDLIVYVFVGVAIIIILISFDNGGPFGNGPSIQALSSIMFLYGFGSLPFSYIFTYRPTASSSMTFLIWIQVLFGTIATVVIIVLETIGEKYAKIAKGLSYLFHFVPNFAFSNGVYKYITHAGDLSNWQNMDDEQRANKCKYSSMPCCDPKSIECEQFDSYYAGDNSITINLVYLTVHIFLYTFILLLIDSGIPRKYIEQMLDSKKDKTSNYPNLDEDVADEKQRIQTQINETRPRSATNTENGVTQLSSDVLQVANLRKYFRNFYAVRGLNFGVRPSECFGLLGINGAGKTTTFKMLTGELFPTTGFANLLGYRLDGDKLAYLKQIGYCPQFDALNLTLTCSQMLTLFAYLRGIPSNKIKIHVKKWINKFGIKQYENIRCGNLSGGNKRKLSTAIALIGNPPLVMLDEPTSGVDPVARRNLWDILAELRKSGQSIVLTSHSMDECEALCDRLAIMVDGQMKCIGNIQHLKSKFGQGFTVMMKLKPVVAFTGDVTDSANAVGNLKMTIESKYACTLKDEHTGMLLYHVTNPDARLGDLFQFMESLKTHIDILEDYTVCDTSLEQVFLSFAKDKIKDIGVITTNVAPAIV